MRIFIEENRFGYGVSQFDGKHRKVLEYGIFSHGRAMHIAKEWEGYYRNLGYGVKVVDISRKNS